MSDGHLQSEHEAQEVWFTNCTQKTIKDISALRKKGHTLAEIADKSGYHSSTVARYLRALDRYGIAVFARD